MASSPSDDGIVAVSSARLPSTPLYCVPLNHTALVNPHLIREWHDEDTDLFLNHEALEHNLQMYTQIIHPILESKPPRGNTDCIHQPDPHDDQLLLDILQRFRIELSSEDTLRHTFVVEPTSPPLTIAHTGRAESSLLSLQSPSGLAITPATAEQTQNIEFTDNGETQAYSIFIPEPGTWEFTVTAASPSNAPNTSSVYLIRESVEETVPPLRISLRDGDVFISWHDPTSRFSLESLNTLSPGWEWTSTISAPQQVGEERAIRLSPDSDQSFFRLRQE